MIDIDDTVEEEWLKPKEGFNDGLSTTKPDWIKEIHRKYLTAGADCIETNTFGSNKIKLDEYGFGSQTIELNQKNAELARSVCDEFTDRQRFVIGSMGPTGYLPSSNDADLGQMPLSQIRDAFELQAEGLIKGNADALLIETSQDILEVKLAVEASHIAMEKTGKKVTKRKVMQCLTDVVHTTVVGGSQAAESNLTNMIHEGTLCQSLSARPWPP